MLCINSFWGELINFQGKLSLILLFVLFFKGIYSIRKEFAPRGSKFFPYSVDPFSERNWHAVKQTGSLKNCLPWRKWQIFYKMHPFPLRYFMVLFQDEYCIAVHVYIQVIFLIKNSLLYTWWLWKVTLEHIHLAQILHATWKIVSTQLLPDYA